MRAVEAAGIPPAISCFASLLSIPYGKFEVKATFGWSWHIITALLINFTENPELSC